MTDKQLKKSVTAFRKGLLGKRGPELMCYAISMPLEGFLNICGIDCKLQSGQVGKIFCLHWWIELSDSRIIDPTASQFNDAGYNMPDVYIGDLPSHYRICSEISYTDCI